MDYDTLYKRRDAAARQIQAAWRAYKGRKAFLRMRDAAQKIQTVAKGWYVRKQVQQVRDRQAMEQRFQAAMERHREKIRILEMEKRTLLKLPGGELEEWEQRRVLAAVRVQAAWRGLVARRKFAVSPERAKREEAARRIQSAFKKVFHSRRSASAVAGASVSASIARNAAVSPERPGLLRQSDASVLIGSPASAAASPMQAGRAEAEVMGAGGVLSLEPACLRNTSLRGTRRYKELQTQIEGKLSAYVALSHSRGAARRPDPRVTDARLAALLAQHAASAPARQTAAHTRQRSLVVVDTLCKQLEQVVPLADLPPGAAPQDFPRPARGTERGERAAQAHALALAEAKVGSRWWAHLKGLNTQSVQASLLAEDEERWEVMDARWRRLWKEVEEQENRRPEVLDEYVASKQRSGAGAAAVAAAREAAALAAKQAEYAAREAAERPLPPPAENAKAGAAAPKYG